jgi:hydrogenase/urease accessory protein HupE
MRSAGRVLVLLGALAGAAAAHELTPSLLSLVEQGPGDYQVTWRVPIELSGERAPVPVWPAEAKREGAARSRDGDSVVERYRLRLVGGLAGRTLDARAGVGSAEVLVRIATGDGRTVTGRIVPGRTSFTVPVAPARLGVAVTYLGLGVEHILTGADHLLFVLALALLVRSSAALVKTVTAFTAAHSLTLALAALGLMRVPSAPVEAVIALSIVFVAREVWLLARGHPGLGARRPWPVAFAFGLLHGLGFAGALGQVGLPATDVPLALFTFNLGVEVGQLMFIVVVLALMRVSPRLPRANALPGRLIAAYGIGTLATFWLLQRIASF